MSTDPATTRKDIDDVLQALDVRMTRIDGHFIKVEGTLIDIQKQIQHRLHGQKHINGKMF